MLTKFILTMKGINNVCHNLDENKKHNRVI